MLTRVLDATLLPGDRQSEVALPVKPSHICSIPCTMRIAAIACLIAILFLGTFVNRVSAQASATSEPVKPPPAALDHTSAIRVPPSEGAQTAAVNATGGFSYFVYPDTGLELYYDGGAQFYGGRASGLFLWVDDKVYGPGDLPAGLTHLPYTPIDQTITGDGSFAKPWVVTTTVAAGSTGVQLQSILRYQTGNRIIEMRTTVRNLTSTPRNVTLFHAGDIYLEIGTNLPDYGYGTYRAANNAVGATTSSGDFAFLFEPLNPAPTAYQEDYYAEVWKAIGGTKPGPGFKRTFRTSYHDVGAGLQWSLWIMGNSSRTVAHQLRLEPINLPVLDPQIHAPDIEDWIDATPLSRRRFVEMYGGGSCPAEGECRLDPVSERWYLENFAFAGALGRCYGLSTMSALFYRGIYDASDFDANATTPYHLTRPNAALEEQVTIYQTLQSDFQASREIASSRFNVAPNEIYAQIKAELDNNNLDPYIITVFGQISTQDSNMWGAPKWEWVDAGHALVPYRIENLANDVHLVFVYDSNFPGSRERAIIFDLVNNTWEYPMGLQMRPSGGNGTTGMWAGDSIHHNIGLVHVSTNTGVRPPLPYQNSKEKSWYWLAADPDWNGNIIISDDAGQRVGVSGGMLVHEISGTIPSMPVNYVIQPAAPSYFVPSGNYHVALESSENTPVTTKLRYMGPGFAFFADSIDLSPTGRINMAIEADYPALRLSSSDATQSVDLSFAYSLTMNTPAGRVINLTGVELGAGSDITASLDLTHGIAILGAGAAPKVYDLNIATTRNGLTDAVSGFNHFNIVVLPNTTHRLDLGLLDGANVVHLTATDAGGNIIEDRLLKNNVSDADSYTLAVTRVGAGKGSVVSTPAGIDCGAKCAASFGHGATIKLTPAADTGSHFVGWDGACSGNVAVCMLRLYEASDVTATFEINSYPLTVTTAGAGAGMVQIGPVGGACASQCVSRHLDGAVVSLVAIPGDGMGFAGWSGACKGTDPICQIRMHSDNAVTATFSISYYPLKIITNGAGAGQVKVTPTGNLCTGECISSHRYGENITLEAKPTDGSNFAGWSGACTGSNPVCEVKITAATTVTASFSDSAFELTVTTAGAGAGTVHMMPGDKKCGTTCVSMLPDGTVVTLEAIPKGESVFTGWFGACSGSNPVCQFTLGAAAAATASFDGQPGASLFIPLITR